MVTTIVAALFKKYWKELIVLGLLIAAVGYGLHKHADYHYNRAVEHYEPIVKELTEDRDQWKQKYEDLERDYRQESEDSHARDLVYQSTIKDLVAGQVAERKRYETTIANKEARINELSQHLDPDLAAVRMPVSVVGLWNLSLEGTASDRDQIADGLAGGPSAAGRAPSEVTLLDILNAGLRNNVEAVRRGLMLDDWESWYVHTSDQIDLMIKEADVRESQALEERKKK